MKKFVLSAIIACISFSAFAQFRLEGGYINQKISDEDSDNEVSLSGVKIGGYYIIKDVFTPNSVTEIGVTFATLSDKEQGIRFIHSDFTMPINFGYICIVNNIFSLRPYVGVNYKWNTKFEGSKDGVSVDMLNGMFIKEYTEMEVNKLQYGGQIGAVCQWKKFTLTYQYQNDFNDLYSGTKFKFKTNAITIGYSF